MLAPETEHVDQLDAVLRRYPRLVVLSGAGISAASGIPTYRDEGGTWLHSKPIKHDEFLNRPETRQRYWARSFVGWPAVGKATPNAAHTALAQLEQLGHISLVITQNVDRLHQRSGSRRVVDLHGRLDQVMCRQCHSAYPRQAIQLRLAQANAHLEQLSARLTPDGDASVPDTALRGISVPDCEACGGMLMPDVVFFGGSVPADRVARCTRAIDDADALLAVGSSLHVFSGYRFCRHAARTGKPLVIINPGLTRADNLAALKLQGTCAPLLQGLALRRMGAAATPCEPVKKPDTTIVSQ